MNPEIVDNIVERHNSLVTYQGDLSKNIDSRDMKLKIFKKEVENSIKQIKKDIQDVNILFDKLVEKKASVSKLFKNVVKKQQLERLESKVEEFNFENLVSVDEFERLRSR